MELISILLLIKDGWWFMSEIIKNNSSNYSLEVHGDGKQVRDILYIDDFVNLVQNSLKI